MFAAELQDVDLTLSLNLGRLMGLSVSVTWLRDL